MDAEKQGYYDRLAADEKIKDLIESYKGITGDCDMFAGIPENLPPMLLKTAAEIRQEFHQIARDFPEYKSLAAMADTRSPIIRGQGVVEEDEVQVSSTRQPGRIQGMVIEEDDPFAAMRKKKEQEKAANAPRNGMVVEDDDAALFAKKPEKPAEKTDDSEWGTLNRQGVPEGKFSPEEEELPDFDISAPAGIIGDAPIPPVSPVPPVPSEPMAESRPESQPEPVAESKPDEPKASDSAENAIVNDESTSAYFRHMEEQREKQKQLLDQEKTQYVNGKLQRESSMEGGAEVNKEDSRPRMMNYRGRIVPEDEYRRLIQQEMEEAGQDEQGEDVVHPAESPAEPPAEPPAAQEPDEPVFFRPEPRPEPTPEVSHKEEPVFFRPQPYSESQPGPHPEPQPEPAASSDVPPDPFESAPEHDPFAPLNESETPKPSTEQPKSEAPFSLFGDKPVDAPAGNEKPSKNQERAEEISRMVHNESDPFAPMKESAKEEQKKSQAEMDIEDALEENTCLRDMTEFSDIFHGNSERKDDEGAKEESGSVFGGFNFKDLFGKIGK